MKAYDVCNSHARLAALFVTRVSVVVWVSAEFYTQVQISCSSKGFRYARRPHFQCSRRASEINEECSSQVLFVLAMMACAGLSSQKRYEIAPF